MMAAHAGIAMVPGRNYRRIAANLLVEIWHAGYGLALSGPNIISWTGWFGSRVLPAPAVPQRPPYGVDASAFSIKQVVQIFKSGTKILNGTGLAILAASGTYLALYTRSRFRSLSVGDILVNPVPASGSFSVALRLHNPAPPNLEATNAVSANATSAVSDSNVHGFSGWVSASELGVRVDAAVSTDGPGAHSMGGDITRVQLGAADASLAVIVAMSAYDATVVANLERLGAAEFAA